MKIQEIAATFNAFPVHDRDGDIAIMRRLYDDGIEIPRHRPWPRDFHSLEKWETADAAEIRRMLS